MWIAGIAVEDAHGLLDGAGHLRGIRDEVGQATLGDDLLAPPLGDEIGVSLVLGWQPLEGGDDALEFQEVRDRLRRAPSPEPALTPSPSPIAPGEGSDPSRAKVRIIG